MSQVKAKLFTLGPLLFTPIVFGLLLQFSKELDTEAFVLGVLFCWLVTLAAPRAMNILRWAPPSRPLVGATIASVALFIFSSAFTGLMLQGEGVRHTWLTLTHLGWAHVMCISLLLLTPDSWWRNMHKQKY